MGFISFILKSVVFAAAVFGLLAFSPFFIDYNPVTYSLLLPERLDGPLTENDKLNTAERLFEGEVKWPESFALHAGKIYTGVSDGRILKIDGVRVTAITRTGKKCDGPWDEINCGRPLGMRFSKKGLLHVVDASYGLLTVDVNSGEIKTLVPSSTVVGNHNLNLLNDHVLDEESGMIYMTQSSTRWNLVELIYMLMEPDSSGRLLAYNTKTKEITVLAENIAMANGIDITEDGTKLLFAELGKFRIMQYYLKGPKKGQLEPLLSNLPAEPDNIRRNKKGNFWIAFNDVRTKSTPKLHDRLSEYPLVRKVIVRLAHAVGSAINYTSQFTDNPYLKELAFNVKSGRFVLDFLPANGMILEVDKDGKILRNLQSTNGAIGHLSQVLELDDGHLYLGSWRNNFIGKIKA